MVLGLEQIKEILLKPKKKELINKAVEYEKRLRFHSETNITRDDIYNPAQDFLNWARGFLPGDKYAIFLQLFRFPLPTPAVVEDVYRELERVFYSRNSSSCYQFTDSSMLEDWLRYKQFKLNEPDVWKTEGWQKMKTNVNSILIVDMPVETAGSKPEPYFYWLDISNVIDYDTDDGELLNWIVFKQPENRIAVFDSMTSRVFQCNEKGEIEGLISEGRHNLGFCPARFFWSTRMTENCLELKKNPITKELANLDWYLFFAISKKHLDLYAAYPIYSAYEADCTFENSETHAYCDGGFLRDANDNYIMHSDGSLEPCPVCSSKRLAGPGTFVDVPVPSEGVDMRNPVQITTIDRNSLDYNVDECTRLKNEIIISVVGSGGTVSEKEAINETQVAANFESKTSVLNALKTNFENAQKFVEDTICKMRYGKAFISSAISWGTEFYVFTAQELYDKYKSAKDNGASTSELDAIANQIIETEYKNNPLQLQRMLTLKQLEPYRHLTMDEVLKLFEKQLLNEDLVYLKINFITFVEKFERENTSILEFAKNKPLYEKIKIISEKLVEYARQERPRITVQAAPTGKGAAGS